MSRYACFVQVLGSNQESLCWQRMARILQVVRVLLSCMTIPLSAELAVGVSTRACVSRGASPEHCLVTPSHAAAAGALFKEAGLVPVEKLLASSSKVLSFRKPLEPAAGAPAGPPAALPAMAA